jgi:acylphosphatase
VKAFIMALNLLFIAAQNNNTGGQSSFATPVQSVFQRVQPLHATQDTTIQRKYRLQLKLHNIDGTRFELSPYKGFRNYVKAKCTEIGLSGYVWRVPVAHGRLLASGTEAQLDSLLELCEAFVTAGYIETFTHEQAEKIIVIRGFAKLPSNRRHVQTGRYSDTKDDDVVSTTSADLPMMVGSHSPND